MLDVNDSFSCSPQNAVENHRGVNYFQNIAASAHRSFYFIEFWLSFSLIKITHVSRFAQYWEDTRAVKCLNHGQNASLADGVRRRRPVVNKKQQTIIGASFSAFGNRCCHFVGYQTFPSWNLPMRIFYFRALDYETIHLSSFFSGIWGRGLSNLPHLRPSFVDDRFGFHNWARIRVEGLLFRFGQHALLCRGQFELLVGSSLLCQQVLFRRG